MAAIAAGKGKGPKPFIGRGRKDRRSGACLAAAATPASGNAPDQSRGRNLSAQCNAGLYRAAALQQLSSGRRRHGWVHEIKFDGYRMQLRVADGKRVTLKTRKGLDWTEKFRAIAESRASACPTASSMARSSRWTRDGVPDFAALQAALSERRDRRI